MSAAIASVLLPKESHLPHQNKDMEEHFTQYGTVIESWFLLDGQDNTQPYSMIWRFPLSPGRGPLCTVPASGHPFACGCFPLRLLYASPLRIVSYSAASLNSR